MQRLVIALMALVLVACSKKDSTPAPVNFNFNSHSVNGESDPSFTYKGVSTVPLITFTLSDKIKESSIPNGIKFTEGTSTPVQFTWTLEDENTKPYSFHILSPSL